MSDLTDFLLARIAEDEAALVEYVALKMDRHGTLIAVNPARIRAECEAKRRLVEMHRPSDARNRWCAHCRGSDGAEYPCIHSRILAAVYADHPDYREEWRP